MGFFDDMPAPGPEPPPRHHPWEPPEAEFPGIVPIDTLLLGRTEEAAAAVTGLSAFSNGFEIFVTAHVRPGAQAGNRTPDAPPGPPMGRSSFRFGLQLSDGRKVIGRRGGPRAFHDSEPDGPILWQFMGGGGPHTHFSRWWAWPLPPKGPLEFVFEAPAFGIPETRTDLDAGLILDAADRSFRLWPEDEG
jgi:hypothetical protein